MIDAAELLNAITEARQQRENVPLPHYTFDAHTKEGRSKGKTKAEFFQQEFDALQPRQTGEFDDLLPPL